MAIGALAILLSPYILVAGVVAGLIYGLPQLPAPFNALVPAPVVEVSVLAAVMSLFSSDQHAWKCADRSLTLQAEHKFEDFSRFLRRQAPAVMLPQSTLAPFCSLLDEVC